MFQSVVSDFFQAMIFSRKFGENCRESNKRGWSLAGEHLMAHKDSTFFFWVLMRTLFSEQIWQSLKVQPACFITA